MSIYTCISICKHIHIYVWIYKYTYTCICIHVYIYAYMYVCVYDCLYTYLWIKAMVFERISEHSMCISRHVFHMPERRCERHRDSWCSAWKTCLLFKKNKNNIYLFFRCDVFQAKHRESRRLSQRLSGIWKTCRRTHVRILDDPLEMRCS